jgi:hypothetical protein
MKKIIGLLAVGLFTAMAPLPAVAQTKPAIVFGLPGIPPVFVTTQA